MLQTKKIYLKKTRLQEKFYIHLFNILKFKDLRL